MGVLVQHHSEHEGARLDAMRVVLGVGTPWIFTTRPSSNVTSSKDTITSLCDIIDALSRVELAAFLHPTNAVKLGVTRGHHVNLSPYF